MTISKVELRPTLQEISLPHNGLWRADGDLRGEQITCIAGQIWLTQENDPQDTILSSGDVFWITRAGCVLLQALKSGRFTFSRNQLPRQLSSN